jgi:hypothetical protein
LGIGHWASGIRHWILGIGLAAVVASPVHAQLTSTDTSNVRIVYIQPTQSFIVPHVGRSFENAFAFHQKLFEFKPAEKVTVLLTDFSDAGNASADAVPRDYISLRIAPMNFAFETFTASERMSYLMNHELVHVFTLDRPAARDRRFRSLFRGKVAPVAEHPESIPYLYLTAPRRASPRWYMEGIAVFLDTWMAGGLGRAQGPYDEMVFRSMVLDGSRFYDPLGLAAELTKTDFQVEANSYLYGTRFMNYLAYTYTPESVMRWVTRTSGSKAYYASSFRQVYGMSIEKAWGDWIAFEQTFQKNNLATIREYPATPYKDVSREALGSLSRAFVDAERRTIYAGLNYPGTLAYLAAIGMDDGRIEHLQDIKLPRIYTVTSLAYDPIDRTLFYTADNTAERDLIAVDPATKRQRTLLKDARIGELSFNRSDRSIWGIRTFNGICTMVRIPYPYTEWNSVYSWPYGEVAYDLDVSPDGQLVSASVGEISGKQTVRVMSAAALMMNDASPVKQFDFGTAIPSNFVFTPDSRYLVGSSYYTGVSNIFRYEIATGEMEALTNAETGFFRPVPLTGDSLLVFRYTGDGFVPSVISVAPIKDVNAITFFGQQVVQKHPILKQWAAGSPGAVPIESLVTGTRRYSPFRELAFESIYPVVQGYKDVFAYGMHARLSDPLSFNAVTVTASFSPAASQPTHERVHLQADYRRFDWTGHASWNNADFYDLFGPTKTSRRGYDVGLGHTKLLLFDEPRRMTLTVDGSIAGDLDQLPEYQNIPVRVERLYSIGGQLAYTDVRSSLGSVDDEKGKRWSLASRTDVVQSLPYTRAYATYDHGAAAPLAHSSIWLRSAAGFSPQPATDPFSNFFFGAFGNNYIDHLNEKRYREYYAMPGLGIDEVGGRNFAKSTIEWNLPPLRFRRVGTPGFYLSWMRPAIFAGGLVTNLDAPAIRREIGNVGGQLDFRVNVLSTLDLTLSVGSAVAVEPGRSPRREAMVSLKILR